MAASEMEAALARHADASWYPEAREVWEDWTSRACCDRTVGCRRDARHGLAAVHRVS